MIKLSLLVHSAEDLENAAIRDVTYSKQGILVLFHEPVHRLQTIWARENLAFVFSHFVTVAKSALDAGLHLQWE